MPGRWKTSSESGFTVLELIVSLAVLSLILAVIPSTLQLARRAWQLSNQIEVSSGEEAAAAYLERTLTSVTPVYERGGQGGRTLAFAGDTAALRFVAEGSIGGGMAGPHVHELTVDDAGRLTISRVPFIAGVTAAGDGRRHVLFDGVRGMRLRYFGQPDDAPAERWVTAWRGQSRLPRLVELTVVSSNGASVRTLTAELKLRRP